VEAEVLGGSRRFELEADRSPVGGLVGVDGELDGLEGGNDVVSQTDEVRAGGAGGGDTEQDGEESDGVHEDLVSRVHGVYVRN
jgi:hypothetical protein